MTVRLRRPLTVDAFAVHAALAPAAGVLAERRALYRMIHGFLCSSADELSPSTVDSPLVRHSLGEAIAERTTFEPDDLAEAIALIEASTELSAGTSKLLLATSAAARKPLARALGVVYRQAGLSGPALGLWTESDDFASVVEAGLRLAREVNPTLADDLLAHVAQVAVLDPGSRTGLVSASSRLFPGLVIIDMPSSPLEVAEALLHEGAHQKFFDLAFTRDFLGAEDDHGAWFQPSWSGANWPIEQVVAAFHAYACMAQFDESAHAAGISLPYGPGSLLPFARRRSTEIGAWLLAEQSRLGADARWLVLALSGEDAGTSTPLTVDEPAVGSSFVREQGLCVQDVPETGRVLVGRPGPPIDLRWLEGDAATVFAALGDATAVSLEQLPTSTDTSLTRSINSLSGALLIRPVAATMARPGP
jgi:hypothetical protein